MSGIAKIIDRFYCSNIGKKLANPTATAATAAAIATVSNVSKDAVNCAYYTTQSLHNERIPEDQRKFVAALDLSNGILNVALQIATAFGLSNLVMSIFDDHIAKTKAFSTKEEVLKEKFASLANDLKKGLTEGEFIKYEKQRVANRTKLAKAGFTLLAVNIAMQILTKRILTPLIATPMATGFKKKFEQAEANKKEQAQKNKEIANA